MMDWLRNAFSQREGKNQIIGSNRNRGGSSLPGWLLDDDAKGLAVDSSGNAYSLSAATSNDYSTIKYDTSGNQIWVANYDGPANGNDQAVGIALDSGGNVYVTGASSGIGTNVDYATTKYDSSGNQVWVARCDGSAHGGDYASAIALDSSGNVHVTGRSFGGAAPGMIMQRFGAIETVFRPGRTATMVQATSTTLQQHWRSTKTATFT